MRRLLDLYCGEGLAAWGYWRSGRFTEIVGVDLNSDMRNRYAFDFIEGDALALDYEILEQFDFIHASPPCQAYSRATPDKSKHMRLIAATHLMLHASAKPYVIENVEGSGKELRPNLVMDGHWFGLPIERRRYFHISTLSQSLRLLRVNTGDSVYIHGGSPTREQIVKAMGLDIISEKRLKNLTIEGMKQGVPPVMTKFIAELVIQDKPMIGSASHVNLFNPHIDAHAVKAPPGDHVEP